MQAVSMLKKYVGFERKGGFSFSHYLPATRRKNNYLLGFSLYLVDFLSLTKIPEQFYE